jgi:DNA-binding response OmpR family regulator
MSQLICIIEDNVPIRKLFCTLLKKNGFDTADFGDGTSGLNWSRQNKPDLLIVDILLPDMNGSDIMQTVRELDYGNSLPIIAATGFAQANDKEKYLEMGFDSYIAKPINTATFVTDIKTVIEDKKSGN